MTDAYVVFLTIFISLPKRATVSIEWKIITSILPKVIFDFKIQMNFWVSEFWLTINSQSTTSAYNGHKPNQFNVNPFFHKDVYKLRWISSGMWDRLMASFDFSYVHYRHLIV